MTGLKRFLRDNGLGLAFAAGFLATLFGQALAGRLVFNAEQHTAGLPGISFGHYLTSASFVADVAENWQSEYLQFFLYVIGTVWLVQRGSPESKTVDQVGRQSDEDQLLGAHVRPDSPRWARTGGWRTALYSRSLGAAMLAIFVVSWSAQSVAGWAAYDESRLRNLEGPLSWRQYLTCSDFWSRTLQNWQSELLAVGSFAVLAVYLRERGSSESKPVGAPHTHTGTEG
ncbi:MAG TPA: DUF6766 family protein [Sporichthya sp.]|nr:DUF6766 family protein [Sporichthya sp.]